VDAGNGVLTPERGELLRAMGWPWRSRGVAERGGGGVEIERIGVGNEARELWEGRFAGRGRSGG